MRMSIADVRELSLGVLQTLDYDDADAHAIVDHLMDCELRGLGYGGLARALTIQERIEKYGSTGTHCRLVHETSVSARLDGGDVVGYLVALEATRIAIEKAAAHGVGVVGAANTWCSGMSSYYLEQVAAKGFVGIAIASGGPLVAPHGSNEAKLGTNPVAIGFPTTDEPVIWDIGTSAIMLSQATLAARTGKPIEPSLAFAPDGSPTTDPVAAMQGAFAAWGGHKGSGLAVMAQFLGFLAGAGVEPAYLLDHAYLIIVIDPAVLGDASGVKARATEFAKRMRAARPDQHGGAVRLPFDGSRARRDDALARGWLDVDEAVVDRARALIAATENSGPAPPAAADGLDDTKTN